MAKKTSPVNKENQEGSSKPSSSRSRQASPTSKIKSLQQRLAQQEAELDIVNSIQQGLAAKLDFQSIVDLVGDKLREVFKTKDFGIRWYDEKTNLVHFMYEYEHGKRLAIPSRTLEQAVSIRLLKETRQPVIANTAELGARIGGAPLPGTDMSKSIIIVPIISSDRLIGSLQMEDYERENAYGVSELRLLTTIAASLGTALENARLFDETQRLLKETGQRNAELAIINSVQHGLVSKLDIQAIYELVGEQLHQVFPQFDISVGAYDPDTDLIHAGYMIEHGRRIEIPPFEVGDIGFIGELIRTRKTILVNENMDEESKRVGSYTLEGTGSPRSHMMVPLIVH